MKCTHCQNDLKRDWAFCPFCGRKVESASAFSGFFRFVNDVLKQFKNEGLFDDESPQQAFSINISNSDGKPNVHVKKLGTKNSPKSIPVTESARALRKPKKLVEEPKTKVREEGNSLFVEILIPGVKSMRDVEIMNFPESIEVRAHSPKKTYYALVQTGRTRAIARKEFEDEKLYLELT